MRITRPAGLDVMPPGYGPLFDQAVAVFAADERVRAMWIHGAVARGAADAGCDLDVSIAVRDDDFDEFAGEWRTWLAAITPTVLARSIRLGSFYSLTPGCERFDVITDAVSKLPDTVLRRRIVVFDRDDLHCLVPPPDDPPPNPATISYLIEEILRQAANFPVAIVRDDWLQGVIAVQQVQLMLYQLFAESNKPQPPTGMKQWSFRLTPYQRQVLLRLPAAAPAEESVLEARAAAFTAFFREAPPIARSNGVAWPAEIEHAVRSYLATQGVPLPEAAPESLP
jgi:hypothetical protein